MDYQRHGEKIGEVGTKLIKSGAKMSCGCLGLIMLIAIIFVLSALL